MKQTELTGSKGLMKLTTWQEDTKPPYISKFYCFPIFFFTVIFSFLGGKKERNVKGQMHMLLRERKNTIIDRG